MSGKKRDLHPEEKELWRRVAKTVTRRRLPLPPEDEAAAPAKAQAKPVRSEVTSAKKSVEPPAKSKTSTPKLLADRGGERRVRRGQVEIEAKLDLHGYTQDGALVALTRFLHSAQKRGGRTVLVVTGWGRGGEGVLKRRLPDWLNSRELKPLITGFAQAHRTHGGAGAFYVFLKRIE
ncbi:MAG: Smr/MutS family protein [Alphaproteobacteria bacterium]